MDRAKEHAKMLSDVGLDFVNLVGQDIEKPDTEEKDGVGLGLAT